MKISIQPRLLLLASIILAGLTACTPKNDETFTKFYKLIEQKDYFSAKDLVKYNKRQFTFFQMDFADAVLFNAFNQVEISEKVVDRLLEKENAIPDSLAIKLYELKEDNSLKMYDYVEAKNAVTILLNEYGDKISENLYEECENDLKIYTALEHTRPQRVVIRGNSAIPLMKDMAGLKNLKVSIGSDTSMFIFDTGANLSVISDSMARYFNMQIIPSDIEVGTATSHKVIANLAVCEKLGIGNIEVYNAVFLVMPDELLYFPEVDYRIYGILGFPVMEALNEIQITKDGWFIVPKEESQRPDGPNFALNGLTPMIRINGMHFRFDTGADSTVLYHPYFIRYQQEIEENYTTEKFSFAGAGGSQEFEGYSIEMTFNLPEKNVILPNIKVVTDTINKEDTYFGNIGQDLIHEFDTLVLNFNQMFIGFS